MTYQPSEFVHGAALDKDKTPIRAIEKWASTYQGPLKATHPNGTISIECNGEIITGKAVE